VPVAAPQVLGVGIDLVVLGEFESMLKRRGPRLLARIFCEGEIAYCQKRQRPGQHFAARFAAKEAAFKALGTGWGKGVDWREVEVVAVWGEAPTLELHGEFRARARKLGARRAHVSLTHAGDYASAVVMLTAK
jgi:holo-[acyl-carrier protein] synthase